MRKTIYCSLLLLFIYSCKKDTPKDPLENTYKLAGNHTWQGVRSVLNIINNGADTIIESEVPLLFDENIVVYDNKKLLFGYDTLYFAYTDRINYIIYTNSNGGSIAINEYIDTLVYNFTNNTIEYRTFLMFNYKINEVNVSAVR